MVWTPNRTWTVGPNLKFTDQTDQVIQFQELLFALKSILVAAGWTVTLSSDTVTAGSGDRWIDAQDIVLGAAGAGSWIVFRSPSAWASNQIDLLLYVNDTGSNPQNAPMRIAIEDTDPYTGGSTVALPTTLGAETSVMGSASDMLPWSTVTDGRYATLYTSRGDVMVLVKVTGKPFFSQCHFIQSTTDADGGGVGPRRWMMSGRTVGATSDVFLTWTSFAKIVSSPDGASATNVAVIDSEISSIVSFNAINSRGETYVAPLHGWVTTAAAERHLGRLFNGDVGDSMQSNFHLPFGALVDIEDTGTLRRVCVTELFVPWPRASLPIE